ncbi:MAG: hypothetical protein V7739_02620 [Motiliproteus sp.]
MRLANLIVLTLCASQTVAAETKIEIYGGPENSVYLGCYSCPQHSQESVHNEYSPYGSAYSLTSIFNKYGKYGSSYSSFSPCSDFAANPPILIENNQDNQDKYYKDSKDSKDSKDFKTSKDFKNPKQFQKFNNLKIDNYKSYGSLSINPYRTDRTTLAGVQRWLNKTVCLKEEEKY